MNLGRALTWRLTACRDWVAFLGWRAAHGWRGTMSHQSLCLNIADRTAWRLATGRTPGPPACWEQWLDQGPDLVIDVGASYGLFTRPAAHCGLRTLAIEPNPSVSSCLQRSMARYPNVSVIPGAAGAARGDRLLWAPKGISGFASLVKRAHSGAALLGTVPQYPIASLVASMGIRPTRIILKIDTEGTEADVLRGALPLLEACSWWRALVEWNYGVIVRSGEAAPAVLWEQTYRPWLLQDRPMPTTICDVELGRPRCT